MCYPDSKRRCRRGLNFCAFCASIICEFDVARLVLQEVNLYPSPPSPPSLRVPPFETSTNTHMITIMPHPTVFKPNSSVPAARIFKTVTLLGVNVPILNRSVPTGHTVLLLMLDLSSVLSRVLEIPKALFWYLLTSSWSTS